MRELLPIVEVVEAIFSTSKEPCDVPLRSSTAVLAGNLLRVYLVEGDHAVLCIDISAIYFNACGYFHCGGGEEGDVAEVVGVELELRGFFEEEVAVRFVGRELSPPLRSSFTNLSPTLRL